MDVGREKTRSFLEKNETNKSNELCLPHFSSDWDNIVPVDEVEP